MGLLALYIATGIMLVLAFEATVRRRAARDRLASCADADFIDLPSGLLTWEAVDLRATQVLLHADRNAIEAELMLVRTYTDAGTLSVIELLKGQQVPVTSFRLTQRCFMLLVPNQHHSPIRDVRQALVDAAALPDDGVATARYPADARTPAGLLAVARTRLGVFEDSLDHEPREAVAA